VNPFLNANLLNRQVGRGKPILNQPPYRGRPVPGPGENAEVLGKLNKLIPELGNAEKFISNAKQFNDLLNKGLNRQTANHFYTGLEALSANIGKEGFNTNSLWRIFEFAFLKKSLFSNNVIHAENITKWKHEADQLMAPKGATAAKVERKHALNEAPASGAKRARVIPSVKNYNVTEVGQQVEVLQEELVAVREELRAVRDDYKREVDFLYQHLGITPPAPPTPPPEPEIEEPEPEAAPAAAATPEISEAAAENPEAAAAENSEEGDAKTADEEMVEPAANGEETA